MLSFKNHNVQITRMLTLCFYRYTKQQNSFHIYCPLSCSPKSVMSCYVSFFIKYFEYISKWPAGSSRVQPISSWSNTLRTLSSIPFAGKGNLNFDGFCVECNFTGSYRWYSIGLDDDLASTVIIQTSSPPNIYAIYLLLNSLQKMNWTW